MTLLNKLALPCKESNQTNMNPLTIKQIQQIAIEHNVKFDVDEIHHLPIVFSEGIILKPTIQYDNKHDGWKMSGNDRKTAGQLLKMTEIKDFLNGKGIRAKN